MADSIRVAEPIRLQHLHLYTSRILLTSVSGRLREVRNKRKFQTYSSKSGRGRLREVVAYKRFPM